MAQSNRHIERVLIFGFNFRVIVIFQCCGQKYLFSDIGGIRYYNGLIFMIELYFSVIFVFYFSIMGQRMNQKRLGSYFLNLECDFSKYFFFWFSIFKCSYLSKLYSLLVLILFCQKFRVEYGFSHNSILLKGRPFLYEHSSIRIFYKKYPQQIKNINLNDVLTS